MSELKWNKKAATYSRYSSSSDSFEAKVLRDIDEFGIDFCGKTVLDIGCGTGIYTLHIAKDALIVDALDFANEMLDILKQDALALHVNNIHTIHSSWENFTCKDMYDIAFSTMSPAMTLESAYEKFDKSGDIKVYLGWNGKRKSSILNPLFELFGKSYTAPKGAVELQKWLENNNKKYYQKEYIEIREVNKSLEDMFENISWHLAINESCFDEKKVLDFLKSQMDDKSFITNKIESGMKLLIWK